MDSERTSHSAAVDEDGESRVIPLRPEYANGDEPPGVSLRIRKLRVIALLAGLGLLAAVSTVFGMMMAVASDLPELEEPSDAQLGDRRPPRRAARPPDRQPAADPRQGEPDRAGR